MFVPVMDVRNVDVVVGDRLMLMPMGMRLLAHSCVLVTVVFVVDVKMIVVERFMRVNMVMPRTQHPGYSEHHRDPAYRIRPGRAITKNRYREQGPDKWCRRKNRRVARGPQNPQRVRIEDD